MAAYNSVEQHDIAERYNSVELFNSTERHNSGTHYPTDGEQASLKPLTVTPPTTNTKPPPPPDAWLQVLGLHLLFINSWGIVNAFGAYQAYYSTHQLLTTTSSNITWIGTMQGFLLIVTGVLSGPLYDLGYLRTLIATGTFLIVFGLMMASIAEEYYEIFLSMGLGCGCLFVPSIAIVSTYFGSKRATATGLAAAGGRLGGVIFPIVFRRLQPSIAYGWATRVIAFLVLATQVIAFMVSKPRSIPGKGRSLLDSQALREAPFMLYSISLFLVFMGLYIPFFFIPTYAISNVDRSEDMAFYMLAIMNAGSVLGRIGPNILADKVGADRVLVTFTLIAGFLAFVWIGIHSVAGTIVFCILYGFFSGAIVSSSPSALVILSPDLSVVGTRMGIYYSFASFGLLIGNPIAGAIVDSSTGYTGLKSFCGATLLAGFALMTLALLVPRAPRK